MTRPLTRQLITSAAASVSAEMPFKQAKMEEPELCIVRERQEKQQQHGGRGRDCDCELELFYTETVKFL